MRDSCFLNSKSESQCCFPDTWKAARLKLQAKLFQSKTIQQLSALAACWMKAEPVCTDSFGICIVLRPTVSECKILLFCWDYMEYWITLLVYEQTFHCFCEWLLVCKGSRKVEAWLKTQGHEWAEEEQELGMVWNLVGFYCCENVFLLKALSSGEYFSTND